MKPSYGQQSLSANTKLKTLATALGVSVSTVSRAISGKKGVSEKQRTSIIALADKMGIKPDEFASALRLGKRKGLAIVIPSIPTEVTALRNNRLMSKGAQAFGSTSVFVHQSTESLDGIIRFAIGRKCEAILLSGLAGGVSPQTMDLIKTNKVAVTVVDGYVDGLDHVVFQRDIGTFQASRLFLLSGRKNIHFFSCSTMEIPDSRLQGILAAYDSLKISREEIRLHPVKGMGLEDGYRIAREIISQAPVDALFCYNDAMALGALKAFQEQSIRIPNDVALIGFDNLPFTAYLPIPLSTVSQPMDEAVEAAIRITQQRLEHFDASPIQEKLPCNLIVRESAPIPSYDIREQIFAYPP